MRSIVVTLLLASLLIGAASLALAQQLDHYLCYRATGPITIDGKLDEPSWQKALWSGPFVHLVTGKPVPPMLQSRAALLWDDTCLYVCITEKEEDVKASMTERDDRIYADYMDAEFFISSSDSSDAYYEFEVNALNTIYEVFWVWKDVFLPGSIWDNPTWDLETQEVATLSGVGGHVHPRGERWGFLEWDFPGIRTAVWVDGTLNQSDDTDTAWTVELAFPWEGMHWLAQGRSLPPLAGDVWRVDCSRFGYGRVTPDLAEQVDGDTPGCSDCAGWAWNQHGYWDSHMPEMFTYAHFTAEGVEAAPQVRSAAITPAIVRAAEPTLLEVALDLDASPEAYPSLGRILVDLSAVGGPAELTLEHKGGGSYSASHTITPTRAGEYPLPVHMESAYEWDTEGTRYRMATVALNVYPQEHLNIYDDAPAPGWRIEVTMGQSDPASSAFSRTGSFSHAIGAWTIVEYVYEDPEEIDPLGYEYLEFYINGGESSGQDPTIADKRLSSLGVVPEANTWSQVIVPVSQLPAAPLTINIRQGVGETFYIDDMKLVAADIPVAVKQDHVHAPTPLPYGLAQNHPNPFNARTAICYALPDEGAARLRLHDLTGQCIRTLVNDQRPAGAYSVVWDGTDTTGRDVASGLYLYCLEAGSFLQTRRMVLLR